MLYIDIEGFLKDADEDVDFQEKFFNQIIDFHLDTLAPAIINSSVLHKVLNHLIEMFYKVNIVRVSRTEKNKGGDYPSTAYTITAGLESLGEYIPPGECERKSHMLDGFVFTLKGASINFLQNIIQNQVHFINKFYSVNDKEFISQVLKKDTQLYQFIVYNKVDCCVQFNLIKIVRLKKEVFELNALDQAVYLSFVTKFMEMLGNYMISGEFDTQLTSYELFLLSILDKYFEYEIIDVFNRGSG